MRRRYGASGHLRPRLRGFKAMTVESMPKTS
jgi:hypothetical protein